VFTNFLVITDGHTHWTAQKHYASGSQSSLQIRHKKLDSDSSACFSIFSNLILSSLLRVFV